MTYKRGDIIKTDSYGDVEIRVDLGNEMIVRFIDTDTFVLASRNAVQGRHLKDLNKRSVVNVGYIGYGLYDRANARQAYNRWSGMLNRCYNKNAKNYDTYGGRGVYVCSEWHNFQNYAKWYDSYKYKKDSWEVDKDILVFGNRVYSPTTCCIVPAQINQAISSIHSSRGEYLRGVSYDPKQKRYRAQMNRGTDFTLMVESFVSEIEAAEEYCRMKETYLVALAYEWKGEIDPKVFDALINFKIPYKTIDKYT